MPTSNRPTLAELREQVKEEARVKGADNLDGFINTLLNELLVDYAQKNRYFEFLVTNYPITTLAATSGYDLPDDFMSMRLVRYRTATGWTRTLHPRSGFVDTPRGSIPRYYENSGNQLMVFPVDDLLAGDTILVDYYKVPDTLTDADIFPVPRLVPTVKLAAITRVLIFNNEMAQAAALKGEATENEVRTKPASG
jgi:hypothetical protein